VASTRFIPKLRSSCSSTAVSETGVQKLGQPEPDSTILKALERMGYKGTMTGHGFRGLASTMLHEREYPRSTSSCSLPMHGATRSALHTITPST
jgi:hypothetical protein